MPRVAQSAIGGFTSLDMNVRGHAICRIPSIPARFSDIVVRADQPRRPVEFRVGNLNGVPPWHNYYRRSKRVEDTAAGQADSAYLSFPTTFSRCVAREIPSRWNPSLFADASRELNFILQSTPPLGRESRDEKTAPLRLIGRRAHRR